ncbi:phosphonate transport system substrate-binding protein [Salirhabdus euzebyi]|uniref:Phosphonate transport system substrate-binding protein n=1 Tax=Salirhabdus euzebyi TaxID=394506 RepID=A0A841Q3N8_9BACI|nr:phosphate/phosphite/phosphonate ABC transporter substrate-binding protein [Salirhabdus euzebyi]MBB6453021.1 phosphonate transport system substrate-binding protein [Salirhabdus euzebyi]
MKKFLAMLFVLTMIFALAACGTSDEDDTQGTDGDAQGEDAAGETPEKIVMGFVPSQDSETIADTVQPLADRLSEELGIEVVGQVMTDYTALVEAMGANQVQVGFIPAFGYVQANQQYDVEVILKSIRYGSGTYRAQYVVRADSGIESLADLEGKVWAYGDQGSTSGYLFPANQLMAEFDIANPTDLETDFFSGVVQTGGHDNSVQAVYDGDADVATTFEDARTEIEENYPDVMEKLKVIGYTEDIPNDTISVTKELNDELVQQIKTAFLAFNDDEEMIAIMKEVYNWDAISEATDAEYKVVKDTYEIFKESLTN